MTVMGRRREALPNLRRSLELKDSILERNCQELGAAYEDLAEACTAVLSFKEAFPLCLKALEIYEFVQVQRLLEVFYTGLVKNEEALEQNVL